MPPTNRKSLRVYRASTLLLLRSLYSSRRVIIQQMLDPNIKRSVITLHSILSFLLQGRQNQALLSDRGGFLLIEDPDKSIMRTLSVSSSTIFSSLISAQIIPQEQRRTTASTTLIHYYSYYAAEILVSDLRNALRLLFGIYSSTRPLLSSLSSEKPKTRIRRQ